MIVHMRPLCIQTATQRWSYRLWAHQYSQLHAWACRYLPSTSFGSSALSFVTVPNQNSNIFVPPTIPKSEWSLAAGIVFLRGVILAGGRRPSLKGEACPTHRDATSKAYLAAFSTTGHPNATALLGTRTSRTISICHGSRDGLSFPTWIPRAPAQNCESAFAAAR